MPNDLELAIQKAIDDNKILVAPSLRAIAVALNVRPVQIYTISKLAIPNVIYDARAYNWDAIAKYVARRFDPDIGIANFTDLIDKAIETEQNLFLTDGRKRPRVPKVQSNGRVIPARKLVIEVGSIVKIKEDDKIYTVVYLTSTHTVLQIDELPELTCFSNWTYNNRIERVNKNE